MNLKGIIFDLDGTVYRGDEAVPGAAPLIGHLHAHGVRTLFVTNRANRPPEGVRAHLQALGIRCIVEDVLTSSEATAEYLHRGSVYLIGEAGIRAALEHNGFTFTDNKPDYVIVSFDREFNYAKLRDACLLIQQGARFVATNPDKGLRMPEGVMPGTGAIVASIVAATGATPLVVGKPEPRILEIALRRMKLSPDTVLTVGDNIETDMPASAGAGITSILILTGISTRADLSKATVLPQHVVGDYAELRELLERLSGFHLGE